MKLTIQQDGAHESMRVRIDIREARATPNPMISLEP